MIASKKCPVCGSTNTSELFKSLNTHGRHMVNDKESFSVMRCSNCQVVYLGDIEVDKKYYKKYYELGYYDDNKIAGASFLSKVMNRLGVFSVSQKSKIILRGHASSEQVSVLDFGCGSGVFLSSLSDKKFKKAGLEINPEGQAICRSKGIKVYGGEISQVEFGREKFDVVMMWHVLEHLDNPSSVLRAILKILVKDGKLIIQTPNTDGLGFRMGRKNWFHIDSPRHLVLYNAQSMGTLAEESGFKLIKTVNEYYDYPLDLFWSVREHKLKFIVRLFYPLLKIYSRENLTYILEKK